MSLEWLWGALAGAVCGAVTGPVAEAAVRRYRFRHAVDGEALSDAREVLEALLKRTSWFWRPYEDWEDLDTCLSNDFLQHLRVTLEDTLRRVNDGNLEWDLRNILRTPGFITPPRSWESHLSRWGDNEELVEEAARRFANDVGLARASAESALGRIARILDVKFTKAAI